MNASDVYKTIIAALVATSGLAAPSVTWLNRKQIYFDPKVQQRVMARVLALTEVGTQDTTYEDQSEPISPAAWGAGSFGGGFFGGSPPPVVTGLVETTRGIQRLTIEIRCEALQEADDNSALQTIDRIRRRLFWASTRSALASAHVSVWLLQPTQELPANVNDRVMQVAAFDAVFGVAFNESDTLNPISWIETAEYTGTLV